MANEQNLIPFSQRAESEQRAIRVKGGQARQEQRRRAKAMREAAQAVMEGEFTSKSGRKLNGYEMTIEDLNYIANSPKIPPAVRLKAKKLLMDLLGELTQKTDITSGGVPFELKVVNVPKDLEDKVNDYLNGSRLDGQGV